MRFKYTILYVQDVTKSLDFYEKAFGLKRKMLHESGVYAELNTGETTLALCARELIRDTDKNPGRPNIKAPTFEISFETDDVPAALNRAKKAGAQGLQDIEEEPWGQTTSYVFDPDGFVICLCSPVKGAA